MAYGKTVDITWIGGSFSLSSSTRSFESVTPEHSASCASSATVRAFPAYTDIAFVLMAYVVMAYVVMAYVVAAYVAMAGNGLCNNALYVVVAFHTSLATALPACGQ